MRDPSKRDQKMKGCYALHHDCESGSLRHIQDPIAHRRNPFLQFHIVRVKPLIERDDREIIRSIFLTTCPSEVETSLTGLGLASEGKCEVQIGLIGALSADTGGRLASGGGIDGLNLGRATCEVSGAASHLYRAREMRLGTNDKRKPTVA